MKLIARRISGGYTIVELVVVMGMLGILAMMVLPMAELNLQRERERELRRALWQVRDAIDEYRRAAHAGSVAMPPGSSGYPPDLLTLVDGVEDARSPGRRLTFLRRIPRDPFSDPAMPAELSWAIRSYASEPDTPTAGVDLYDITSRSGAVGLNGVPLREW